MDNGSLGWLTVLPKLGVHPASSVLPSVVTCPTCTAPKLAIYKDTLYGGEWHYCRGCGASGDMISLAARVWKTDTATAAVRLMPELTGADLEALKARWARDSAASACVAAMSAPDGRAVWDVTRRLQLPSASGAVQWAARMGRFFGIGTCERVSTEVAGRPDRPGRGWRRGTATAEANFTLTVPFYDVPGRVRGVWVHNDGEPELELVPGPDGNKAGTGVGCLAAVSDAPDHEFGSTVFLVADPFAAVRLHSRNFESSGRCLPVAACHLVGANLARLDNHVLYGKDPIVWAYRTTRELVRQARILNARVAASDGINDGPERHLARYSPRAWLRLQNDNAVSWMKALERLVVPLPDHEVEETLRFMELTAVERNRFRDQSGTALRERLDRIAHMDANRRVEVGANTFVERNGSWFAFRRSRHPSAEVLVTDAPFRVDKVIQSSGQRDRYQVTARFNGSNVTFSVSASEFEGAPFAVVRSRVREAGLGMTYYSPGYGPSAVTVANQFAPAEFVYGPSRCGWDERLAAWVFDNFSITVRGTVEPNPGFSPSGSTRHASVLTRPIGLTPADVDFLSVPDETRRLIWAVAACVINNLLAPVYNRRTSGLALIGTGARTVGGAAVTALGCGSVNPVGTAVWERLRHRAAALEAESGWPVVLPPMLGYRWDAVKIWLEHPGPRNAVVEMDPDMADCLSVLGGWHCVESEVHVSAAGAEGPVSKLVPEFLAWFAQNDKALTASPTTGQCLLGLMAEWLVSLGGDRNAVWRANYVTRFDHAGDQETVALRLLRIVKRAAARKRRVHRDTEGGTFLSCAEVNRTLAGAGGCYLDEVALGRSLGAAGVLKSAGTFGPGAEYGWILDPNWVRSRIRRKA